MVLASVVRAPRERGAHSSLARLCLALGLGAAGLAALPGGHAAAASACRSDPVIVVNGATVDVVSALWTDPRAVKELDYVVTVPAHSLIGKLTLTVGLGFPEKVSYVYSAAQPWGTMQIAATVQTQDGVAPFPTVVTATSPLSLLTGTSVASGLSTSTVLVNVSHLIML